MLLAARLLELGVTADESARTPARHAALRDDPAAVCLRLLRDGAAVDPASAGSLFHGVDAVDQLLIQDEHLIRARYRLDFIEHLYLFSDWPSGSPNEVLPPGETTAILYRAAAQFQPSGAVLDLGCGSGTLALLLARDAGRVVGTDVNVRAVRLSKLNAAWNGIANAEFRLGSLFEPVTNEQFDLIVSQPPYLPFAAGEERHLFLQGGHRGDEIARAIIGGVPHHLTRAGHALVFSDWPLSSGETLQSRIPQTDLRTDLFFSPMITRESYRQNYGCNLAHSDGVRQCLAIFHQGSGLIEHEVLPHEWSHLRVRAVTEEGRVSPLHERCG